MSDSQPIDDESPASPLESAINNIFTCEDVEAQRFVLRLCLLLPSHIRRKLPADTIPTLISEFISQENGPGFVKEAFAGWRQNTLNSEFDKDDDEPWHVVATFLEQLFAEHGNK